jgi:hypothetical protein
VTNAFWGTSKLESRTLESIKKYEVFRALFEAYLKMPPEQKKVCSTPRNLLGDDDEFKKALSEGF